MAVTHIWTALDRRKVAPPPRIGILYPPIAEYPLDFATANNRKIERIDPVFRMRRYLRH